MGIGDKVHLSLEDAQWTPPNEDGVFTLGKRADWDLEYTGKVLMEVHRGTIPLAVVDVSHTPESVDGPLHEIAVNGNTKANTAMWNRNEESWSSPAFAKRKSRRPDRLAGTVPSFLTEDDGYIPGKGRKRAKFSRNSGSWRYLERSPSFDDRNQAPHTASPVLDQSEDVGTALESALESFRPDHRNGEVNSVDAGTSQIWQHEYSTIISDKAPEVLMPPPPLTLEQQQHVGESSATRLAVETEGKSGQEVEDHQQADQIATPPRATTPRLLPVPSQGLPLISPLIKRQGAAVGYFPPMLGVQSELDSSADMDTKSLTEERRRDTVSPFVTPEAFASQPAMSSSEDGSFMTVSGPATQAVDLASSTMEDEELQREQKAHKGETESPPSGRIAKLKPEQSILPSDEFEFPDDSPVEPRPIGQISVEVALDHPNKNIAELALLESSTDPSFTSTVPQQVEPLPTAKDGEDPRSVCEFADQAPNLLPLEELSKTQLGQFENAPESHLSSEIFAISDKEDEQEHKHILSDPSSATRQSLHYSKVLEISAQEAEYNDLPVSAPPFPFKQRWDTKAKRETKAHQALPFLNETVPYVDRRISCDGTEDGSRSHSGERSGTRSSLVSERASLLYDNDDNVAENQFNRYEERSCSEGDDSKPPDRDESHSPRNEDNDAQTAHIVEELDEDDTPSIVALDREPGAVVRSERAKAADLGVFSKSVDSDIHMTDDEIGQQSPPLFEGQGHTQRLPEMPLSRSPSIGPEQDAHFVPVSLAAMLDLPSLANIEEQNRVYAGAVDVADSQISNKPEHAVSRNDQLATPNNSQRQIPNSHPRDPQGELRDEKPEVELPLSPQNTQDPQVSQGVILEKPRDAKNEQKTLSNNSAAVEPEPNLEATETIVKNTTLSLKETRRRSSRLSLIMPLSAKDPSEIVIPYFTPKKPNQHDKHDEILSSPPHRSLTPEIKNRDNENVVVLIPPPAEKRSQLDLQSPVTSGRLDPAKSPSPKSQPPTKGFTTPHSYYPSLSSVPTHFDEEIDVLAVAVNTSKQAQRAKSGPRDYFLTLKVADSSCNARDTASIQLFRPYKEALPICARGDILLLRGMKVQTRRTLGTRGKIQKNKDLDGMMLLSTDSSAWAVFKFLVPQTISAEEGRPGPKDGSARLPAKRATPIKMDAQINGPPVEFGAEERAFARGLNKWWIEAGEAVFPEVKRQPHSKTKGKEKEKIDEVGEHDESLHDHELRDGMAYGDMISPMPLHEHSRRDSQSHHEDNEGVLHEHGDIEESLHEHELRDGIAYGDTIGPKPPHKHHHDHDHDHDHSQLSKSGPPPSDPHTRSASGSEDPTLHEHELRDGMAYGDTIAPRPIHPHFPLDGHDSSPPGQHSGVGSSSSPIAGSHREAHVHNLRNGISYGNADAAIDAAPASTSTPSSSRSKARTRRSRGGDCDVWSR